MSAAQTIPKADPERLALRAAPRPVTRLNRRVLAIGAGVLATAVLGATLWSLQAPKKRSGEQASELYNVDRISRAEKLDQLPKDYSEMPAPLHETEPEPAVPELGEPLPGDLGTPMLKHQQQNDPYGSGYANPENSELARQQNEADAAAKGSLFFRNGSQRVESPASQTSAASATPQSNYSNSSFDPMTAVPVSTQPSDPTAIQNRQDQKQAFVEKSGDAATQNPGTLQKPASPYQVMAGTIIPAALVTGINSDLPGQVIANVTEAVYDTATGQHLLIPQGSKLLGRYDSQIAFGQRRVLLVWTRLILPDTSSISLDRLPGVDPAGYAGLEDGVDWHWNRILSGAALSTLLGVGAELAAPNNTGNSGQVIIATRDSAQDTINQVGQEITRRNLSVQPTLTIRPGFPMRVIVNKDLVLRPYQPLIFQRGSP